MNPIVYLNGQFLPIEKASIGILDLGIHRAYGVFDFFKIVNGHNPYLDLYIKRLLNSLKLANISHDWTPAQLETIVNELIHQNSILSAGIKVIVTAGPSANGYEMTSDPTIVMIPFTLPETKTSVYKTGAKLLPAFYMRDIPEIKTTNYMYAGIHAEKLKLSGSVDFLFHDDNCFYESSRCNVFYIHRNIVYTPSEKILNGITRQRVLALNNNGWDIREVPKSEKEALYSSSEVFITSTTKNILPIVQIGDIKIGNGEPGPITKALMHEIVDW